MSNKALVSHPSDKALSRYEHKINLGEQDHNPDEDGAGCDWLTDPDGL